MATVVLHTDSFKYQPQNDWPCVDNLENAPPKLSRAAGVHSWLMDGMWCPVIEVAVCLRVQNLLIFTNPLKLVLTDSKVTGSSHGGGGQTICSTPCIFSHGNQASEIKLTRRQGSQHAD